MIVANARQGSQTCAVRWVVIGCGYVGSALAARLVADGQDVVATRRTAFQPPPGARALVADLGRTALPDADVVVCCAPPPADIARLAGARRLVYLSSTGVYAPAGGAWVDETWPVA